MSVERLGEFLAAGWRAVTTGELPKAAAVSSGAGEACPICQGAGELEVDGTFVSCPAPRHKPPTSPAGGTR